METPVDFEALAEEFVYANGMGFCYRKPMHHLAIATLTLGRFQRRH
jgi:hypothetical protein